MTQILEEIEVGDKLMVYGEDLDIPRNFLYTPKNTTVEYFLANVGNRKCFRKFVESIQNAFNKPKNTNIDEIYKNCYRARRTGKMLGILGIEECTKYIMAQALGEYCLEQDNVDLDKLISYASEFKI